jgi:hypothetical protein
MQRIWATLKTETAKTFSLELLGSCFLFLTIDAKNLEVSTFKDNEKDCIRRLLSNWQSSFTFYALHFFLSLQRTLYLLRIMLYRLFFLGVISATLSKTSFVSTECLALCFGEELWRLILLNSPTKAFLLTSQRKWRTLYIWKYFGCHCGQCGIGFNWFLDIKVICTGNNWWRGTQRRCREGEFCRFWHWMWVWGCCTESRNYHSIQVCTFRRYKSAFEKCWLHTTFQLNICIVRSLYSTPRMSVHVVDYIHSSVNSTKATIQSNRD